MSFKSILGTLTLTPLQVFLDALCSLLNRFLPGTGWAILAMSLTVCLLATPLRPKKFTAFKTETKRRILLLVLQAAVLAASWRWFSGVKALRGVSFGPIPDLGFPGGFLLFWGGYAAFAVLRRAAGFGYRPMELNPKQKKTDRNNRKLMISSSLYLAMLTGLLIPSSLLAASPAEFVDSHYFRDPVRYLLSSGLIAFGTFALWGCLYGWLLSPKARKKFTALLAVLAAVSAVDYMFFGKEYGFISSALQYETAITSQGEMVLLNAGCILVTVLIVLLLRKKWPVVLRIFCLYGSVALAVLSVINTVSVERKAQEVKTISARVTEEQASFRLDRSGKNVVVIMLDRAISGFVPYLLSEKPELKEQFDGFTWYPNTLSYGYHTNIAAPALFGGYEYTPDGLEQREDVSLKDKHNEALKLMPVLFLEAEYEVTVCDAPYANYQGIPDLSIYDEYPEIRAFNTIGMFDEYKIQILSNLDRNRNRNLYFYSLFRSAPLALQEILYDRGRYLAMDADADDDEDASLIGVSPDFLNSYMALKNLPALTEVTDEGTCTFLMLTNDTTHDAVELQKPDYTPQNMLDNDAYEAERGIRRTEDGQELDLTDAPELVRIHYDSDMAAFLQLGAWFDVLREQGVYDNTRIIIVSDHGYFLGLFGVDLAEKYPELASLGEYSPEEWSDTMCYNPLLMVKDFGASGFTTDRTFMTNAETPALALAGLAENPVNPFTGNPVSGGALSAEEHHVVESDWHIVTNCGNTFSNPLRITFRGQDVFDPDNWFVDRLEEAGEP